MYTHTDGDVSCRNHGNQALKQRVNKQACKIFSSRYYYYYYYYYCCYSGWYLRQKPVGGSRAGGLPTLPFSLSLPSPFPFPLSFQTNQWEGRSDPVRGNSPASPLQIPLCCFCCCCYVGIRAPFVAELSNLTW